MPASVTFEPARVDSEPLDYTDRGAPQIDAPPGITAWHPFLFAAFPTLAVWAGNFHETALADMLLPLAVSVGGSAAVMWVFSQFFPTPQRAALATALVVLYVFGYGLTYHLNAWLAHLGSSFLLRDRLLLPIWNLLFVGLLFAIRRAEFDDERPTQFLNIFSAVLFVLTLGSLVATAACTPLEAWPNIGIPAARNEEPIALSVPDQPRDVYCLVFDRYADAATLAADFKHDNKPFLDGLRRRGFVVPEQPRTNYAKTEVAMSAVLNMMYHGEQIGPVTHYRDLLNRHRVGQLFRQAGYHYYHFGCPLDGLRTNPQATANYRFSRMPSEFAEILYRLTPFYVIWPSTDIRRQELEKFAALSALAKTPVGSIPKFVYSHFLVPHEPWKFKADGSYLSPAETSLRREAQNYALQVEFANREIEKLVDQLLARPEPKPIILILADEGPDLHFHGDMEKTDAEKIRKRSGILAALYLPGKQKSALVPDKMTSVNAFRLVFREYFGADLPPLPDKVFYWDNITLLGKPDFTQASRFVDVTADAWVEPAEKKAE